MLVIPQLCYSQREIKICDLEPIDIDVLPFRTVSYKEALTEQNGSGIEAWSKSDKKLFSPSFHPFISATHYAYAHHIPLRISPDMIWLLICQGFARHVDMNSEELRHHFVDFDGKKVLCVKKDFFIKGSEDNDWLSVFPEFTKQIEEYTGETLLDNVVLEFSTTSVVEKAAFEVTLMDAMSSYFIYKVLTRCGIPSIILEGTTEDWVKLLNKTIELSQYDLAWWTKDLIPHLEKFILSSQGNTPSGFWEGIYKSELLGSGSPKISGWIVDFFPYLRKGEEYIKKNEFQYDVNTTSFSSGISRANFYWEYFDDPLYQMEFIAGFVGASYEPEEFVITPEIGWAIRDTGETGIKESDKEYAEEIMKAGHE